MEKRIINYNPIKGIVDYVIEWYNEGIAIRVGRKEIEAIGALYGMTPSEVLDKIIRELETTPCNENGDYLSVKIEEKPVSYVLHAKLDDEEEED